MEEFRGTLREDAASPFQDVLPVLRLATLQDFKGLFDGGFFAELAWVFRESLGQVGEIVGVAERRLQLVETGGPGLETAGGDGTNQHQLVEQGFGGGAPGMEVVDRPGFAGGSEPLSSPAVPSFEARGEDRPAAFLPGRLFQRD